VNVSLDYHTSVTYPEFFLERSTNTIEERGQRAVLLKMQMSESRILIRFLWVILQGTGNLDLVGQNVGISERLWVEPSKLLSPHLGTSLLKM
jgi:hypothetical protein